jgi:hypothetical protein
MKWYDHKTYGKMKQNQNTLKFYDLRFNEFYFLVRGVKTRVVLLLCFNGSELYSSLV